MAREIIERSGLCRASIRTAEELEAIRSELAESSYWMGPTVRWLGAVKDPTRFKLVHLLERHDRLCVCDLANILGVSSSAVSQHLRKLKDMNLVSAFRQKQTLFYALNDADFIAFFLQLADPEPFEAEAGTSAGAPALVASVSTP